MQARMKNPGSGHPDAMTAIRALNETIKQGGVPPGTLDLVHLRASQINGCSVCVGAAAKAMEEGETEAVTRLSDRTDPVPDEIWDEAARYHPLRSGVQRGTSRRRARRSTRSVLHLELLARQPHQHRIGRDCARIWLRDHVADCDQRRVGEITVTGERFSRCPGRLPSASPRCCRGWHWSTGTPDGRQQRSAPPAQGPQPAARSRRAPRRA